MYKDSHERIDELLEESAGLEGMLDEASMKLKILKVRWKDGQITRETLVALTEQISSDLDTYKSRLDEIYEELDENGTFNEL